MKANVLATLTATLALNFTMEHKAVEKIADIIMNTLPVCSERKMSYSTFTVVDIEHHGMTTILEYDNPGALILRSNKPFDPGWKKVVLQSEKNAGKEIRSCTLEPLKEDRILFCSDGISQSGMEGIDLVAEGILTLTKVSRILKEFSQSTTPGKGPAERIVKLLRQSDQINFIIGTRINIAHQDPNLPVDLEMRRTVVSRMARILEDKFLKEVSIRYL